MRNILIFIPFFTAIISQTAAQYSRYSKVVPIQVPEDKSTELYAKALDNLNSQFANQVQTNKSYIDKYIANFEETVINKMDDGCTANQVRQLYNNGVKIISGVSLTDDAAIKSLGFKLRILTKEVERFNCLEKKEATNAIALTTEPKVLHQKEEVVQKFQESSPIRTDLTVPSTLSPLLVNFKPVETLSNVTINSGIIRHNKAKFTKSNGQASKVLHIQKNERINILSTKGKYYYCEHSGILGYVLISDVILE